MKNIVVSDEYRPTDLKPVGLIKEYAQLTKTDVVKFFLGSKKLANASCPACLSKEHTVAFERFGLNYRECSSCFTLFVSPRPDDAAIKDYYSNSRSRMFWFDKLTKATDVKRKEKIIKPRMNWLEESTREYLPQAKVWADIGTGQYGYLEAMKASKIFQTKILIDPFIKLDQNFSKGNLQVVEENWFDYSVKGQADVVSIFEVLDRTADVSGLVAKIHQVLKKGGLCFLTGILSSGFDIQAIWDQAENIFPPDRLNIFSLRGLRALFEKNGFECLELSTPGILDVDIVLKVFKDNPKVSLPRFAREIITADEEVRLRFQQFLQENQLSSYGRILIRKK